jgi:hypothetical protein
LSGRIIPDKLWFYTSGRRVINDEEVLNALKPDGSPAVSNDLAWFQTDKISYQMSSSNRFVGFFMYNHKYDMSNLSQFRAWEYRGGLNTLDHTFKTEWQKTYGNSFVTSLQYGKWEYWGYRWTFSPRGIPATQDIRTDIETGRVTDLGQEVDNPRHHFKGTATWFKSDLFAGNHEFKFGFDYTTDCFGRQYPERPLDYLAVTSQRLISAHAES